MAKTKGTSTAAERSTRALPAETRFNLAFAAAGEIEELASSLLDEFARADRAAPLRRAAIALLSERIVEVSRAVIGIDDDDREPTEIAAKIRDGLDVLGGWGARLDPAHGPMPDRADLPAALHALRANGADAHRIDQVRIALGEQIERDSGNREAIAALLARIAALAQGQIERADELAGGDLRGTA